MAERRRRPEHGQLDFAKRRRFNVRTLYIVFLTGSTSLRLTAQTVHCDGRGLVAAGSGGTRLEFPCPDVSPVRLACREPRSTTNSIACSFALLSDPRTLSRCRGSNRRGS
jgi:hypothetical protein